MVGHSYIVRRRTPYGRKVSTKPFLYRYLDTDVGTSGAYIAQIIRNNEKEQKGGYGSGTRTTVLIKNTMIKPRELAMSKDFEGPEIAAPADLTIY